MSTDRKFPTRCVHEGEIKDTMYQGIFSPLFMSTTYPWFGGDAEKKPYPRYFNTPNQEFLSKKIASEMEDKDETEDSEEMREEEDAEEEMEEAMHDKEEGEHEECEHE